MSRGGVAKIHQMPFPTQRPRRLRSTESMRALVRETRLHPANFILPLFIVPGEGIRNPISSMPPQCQLSIDNAVEECREIKALGISGVILFGLPESKDEEASGAYDDQGIVQRAVRAIKQEVPELLVITDVCNCEYTSHGHCGKIVNGDVDNDITLGWLARSAVSHARAGADIIAPSDMMDGRVAAILHPRSMPAAFRTRQSSPTLRNSRPYSTGHSAKPPIRLRSLATGAVIRWTPRMPAKP